MTAPRRRLHAVLLVVLLALAAPVPAAADPPPARTEAAAPRPGWAWPVGTAADPPHVLARYDPPPQRWSAGHRGVDLAAEPSAPVRAAGPGVVTFAGVVAARGVVTVLHRSGVRTTYEPVLPAVPVGTAVRGGEVIGALAPAGHCAPHACLHWGALRGRDYLDPLRLLRPVRVRLLPNLGAAPTRAVARGADGADPRRSGPWVGLLVGPP